MSPCPCPRHVFVVTMLARSLKLTKTCSPLATHCCFHRHRRHRHRRRRRRWTRTTPAPPLRTVSSTAPHSPSTHAPSQPRRGSDLLQLPAHLVNDLRANRPEYMGPHRASDRAKEPVPRGKFGLLVGITCGSSRRAWCTPLETFSASPVHVHVHVTSPAINPTRHLTTPPPHQCFHTTPAGTQALQAQMVLEMYGELGTVHHPPPPTTHLPPSRRPPSIHPPLSIARHELINTTRHPLRTTPTIHWHTSPR